MPVLALFVLSLLWGSTFYFTKLLLPDFHAVSIVFYRCLFGGLVLLPFVLLKKKKTDFKNKGALIGITLLSAGVPWVFMSFSQKGLDTTISAVINATGPIFGVLFSVFLLKQKVHRQELLGVAIGFIGIVLSFVFGFSGQFQVMSAIFLLVAVSFYTLSSILTGKFLSSVSVYTLSFVSMAVGSIYSGIFMLLFDLDSYQYLFSGNSGNNFFYFVMLGVFNSGIGNLLYFYLIKSGGAIFALFITYLMPITTILLGVFLLDEPLGFGTIIAFIFVLASIYFTQNKE
ncbi:DMT family transporter [Aeribacillus sp. FSL K6-2848]|jgi:drug/metabolite transporter (DMT)-like permease|uniref:DMT family transporter n=1 Tax=unclassified Aeribacillus TaxID=2640495 RepID=UPI0028724F0A|nr:DMT family transporter [Aeribacillus pallidus]